MVLFWYLIFFILVMAVIGLFSYMVFANYRDKKNEERRLTIYSGNGDHSFKFLPKGAIHWGPEYYNISIDGKELINRKFFFKNNPWSPDSKYFIAEEFLNIDKKNGELKTRIVLFDIVEKKYSNINFETACVWVDNFNFLGNKIICKYTESYNPKKEGVLEMDINNIKNWENYL
jgi:hypothetical protein